MQVISIGRSSTNDLVINDSRGLVSSQHAELIVREDGTMFIRDKGSTNSTYVDGKAIEPRTDISVNRSMGISFANSISLDWSRIDALIKQNENVHATYTIGRADTNTIVLQDNSNRISSSHALIEVMKDGTYFLTDMSKNGTTRNGTSLSNQRVKVNREDSIVFAKLANLDWNKIEEVAIKKEGNKGSKNKKPSTAIKEKSNSKMKTYAILGLAVLVSAGLFIFRCQLFGCQLSVQDVNDKYGSSVVWIQHEYFITVSLKTDKKSESSIVYWIGRDHNNPSQVRFVSHAQRERIGIENLLEPFVSSGTGFIMNDEGLVVSVKHLLFPYKTYEEKTVENYYKNTNVMQMVNEALSKAKDQYANLVDIELGQSSQFLAVGMNGKQLNDYDDMYKGHVLTYSDDPKVDLAVMQIKQKDLPSGSKLTFVGEKNIKKNSDHVVGEKLVVIGYPYSTDLNLKDKNFNKIIEAKVQDGKINSIPEKYQIQYSMSTAPGASGSPVFDLSGNLVAVNYAYYGGLGSGPNSIANFGIKAEYLLDLLDKIKNP